MIRRFHSISFAAVLCALLAYTGVQAQDLHEYLFKVGQFDKVRVLDNVNVVYRCVPDSTGYAAYHGEEDFCDSFILTNSGGTLKIQVSTEDVGKPGLPTLYIYSDFLTSVENSSNFTTTVQSPAPCAKLKALQIENGSLRIENAQATEVEAAVVAGHGNIFLSGDCNCAQFRMMSAGTINADMLKAQDVKCRVFGAGTIGCWAVQSLKSRGLGSTKIYYKGHPQVNKKGGGKVMPLQ